MWRGGIAVASCPSTEQLFDANQLLDAEQLLAERLLAEQLLHASCPSTEQLLDAEQLLAERLLAEQLLDAEHLSHRRLAIEPQSKLTVRASWIFDRFRIDDP